MAQYDGAVRVNTAIDTAGFDRGSKELQQATAKLQRKFESVGKQLEKSVGQYQKALASGNAKDIQYFSGQLEQARNAAAQFGRELGKFKRATFRTDEYKKLQTDVEAAEKALDKLVARQGKMKTGGVKESSKAYQSLQYDIQQAQERLQAAQYDMQEYLDSGGKAPFSGADTAQIKAFSSALRNVTDATSPVQLAVARVAAVAAQAGRNLLKMASASIINGFRLIGQSAAEAARQITKMTATAVSGGIKRLGAWLSNAAKSMTLFGRSAKRNNGILKKSFSTILKYGLGVRSFYFLFRKIRQAIGEGYQNLARYSDTLNQSISGVISSFKRFENQFAASFEPLVNIVAPAISRMIDGLTEATFRAGELFAALNGQKTVIKAKEVEEDYAESLDKEKDKKAKLKEETRAAIASQQGYAESTDESADSLDNETKSAQKLKRQLAGFDELNILKVDKEDDEAKDLFETVPIETEALTFADRIKDMMNSLDLSGIGEILGGKVKVALDDIKWPDIKAGAWKFGKRLASFLNGAISVPKLGKSLGRSIAEAVNSAFAFLDGFVWTFGWKGLGNAIMDTIEGVADNLNWNLINHALQGLAIGLADLLNTIFSRKKVWEKIGVTIGKALNAVVNAGITFLERFDFNEAADAIVTGLNAAIATAEWDKVGQFLADYFGGALQFLRTAVLKFDWVQLGESFAEGLNEFVRVMLDKILHFEWAQIGQGIADGVNAAVSGIGWNSFGTLVGRLIGGALTAVASFIRGLNYEEIVQAIQDFFSGALQQIDFYDLITVWGAAALIVAVKKIIAKHPVLSLLTGAVMALGPELGTVISRMVETIPWAEVGRNVGNFLVNALNRLHEAIKSVDWYGLGKAVGQFLGNINWSEIVNAVFKIIGDLIVAGFKTLGGIIVGMGPKGILNALWALVKVVGAYIGGKTLLTVLSAGVTSLLSGLAFTAISGISAIGVKIAGSIASIGAAIAPALANLGSLLVGQFGVLLTAYDINKLQEAQGAFTDAYETHVKETERALESYKKLYQEKGADVASEWAKTVYQIDTSGMELEEAQQALVSRIDELWKDTPENLAQGFWMGLQDYFGNGNGFLSNLGKLLGDATKGVAQAFSDLFHLGGVENTSNAVSKSMEDNVVKPVTSKWDNLREKMKKPLPMSMELEKASTSALKAWNGVKKNDKATKTLKAKVNGTYTKALASWQEMKDAEATKTVEGVISSSFENAQFMYAHLTDSEATKVVNAKYGDKFASIRNEYNQLGESNTTATKYVAGERTDTYTEVKAEFDGWTRGDATKFTHGERTNTYLDVRGEFEGWTTGDATKHVYGVQEGTYTSAKADFDKFSNGKYGAAEGITKTISGTAGSTWNPTVKTYNDFANGVNGIAGTVTKTIAGQKQASGNTAWDTIVSIYNAFKNGVGAVAGTVTKTISGTKSSVWDSIVSTYNNFKNGVGDVVGSITKTISGAKDKTAATGWDAIVSAYNNFKNGVGSVTGSITKTIFGAEDATFGAKKTLFENFRDGIGYVKEKITKTIFGGEDSTFGAKRTLFENFRNGVGNIQEKITKTLFGAEDKSFSEKRMIYSGFKSENATKTIAGAIQTTGANAWETVKAAYNSVVNSTAVKTITGAAADTFNNVKNAFAGVVSNIATKTIAGAVNKAFTDTKTAFATVANSDATKTIKGAVDKAFTEAKAAFATVANSDAVKTIKGAVNKAFTDTKTAFATVANSDATKTIKGAVDESFNTAKGEYDTISTGTVAKTVNLVKGWASGAIQTVKDWVNASSGGNVGKAVDLTKANWADNGGTVYGWVNASNGSNISKAVNLSQGTWNPDAYAVVQASGKNVDITATANARQGSWSDTAWANAKTIQGWDEKNIVSTSTATAQQGNWNSTAWNDAGTIRTWSNKTVTSSIAVSATETGNTANAVSSAKSILNVTPSVKSSSITVSASETGYVDNAVTDARAISNVTASSKSSSIAVTASETYPSNGSVEDVLTSAKSINNLRSNTVNMTLNLAANWNNAMTSVVDKVKSWLGLRAAGGVLSGGVWHVIPQFKVGGMIKNGKPVWWDSVQKYAGGTLRAGSMFVAGEAGPEIVGHINGRTEVLNKSQIASAIYSAVLAGMEAAVNGLGRYLASHMTVCANAIISALTLTRTPSTVSLSNVDSAMLSRVAALQAIPYQVPAYATGTVMPYEVVAEIRRQTTELKTAIHDEGEAIIQAVVSAISNHGIATTDAIRNIPAGQQTYSADYLVQSTIDEINRRTLAYGRPSLV